MKITYNLNEKLLRLSFKEKSNFFSCPSLPSPSPVTSGTGGPGSSVCSSQSAIQQEVFIIWKLKDSPSRTNRTVSPLFIHLNTYFCIYLVSYLAVLGISCDTLDLYLRHVGSSSLTRNGTQAPCFGTAKS